MCAFNIKLNLFQEANGIFPCPIYFAFMDKFYFLLNFRYISKYVFIS